MKDFLENILIAVDASFVKEGIEAVRSTYLHVFGVVFAIIALGTIALYYYLSFVSRQEMQRLFSSKQLLMYENELNKSLAGRGISLEHVYTASSLASKMGYNIVQDPQLRNRIEAKLIEQNIHVNNKLGDKSQNFCIAHELAHILRGPSSRTTETRMTHSFFKKRPDEEQICDYYAAAMLLPFAYMQEQLSISKYDSMNLKQRQVFIRRLAEEKDVHQDVIIRRIRETRMIEQHAVN